MIHRNCRVKIFDIYKVSECDIKQYILQTNSFFFNIDLSLVPAHVSL